MSAPTPISTIDESIHLTGKKQFQQQLLAWYTQHARDLPWRNTHDPYAITVSELMLQQTQVDRVIPKFLAWMKQFPDVYALTAATEREVIAAWQGLGYNRRALYLKMTAKKVVEEFDGTFPSTRDKLLSLPGIGPYTAGAVLSFAFEQDASIVDTNVKRVVGRVFAGFRKLPTLPDNLLWNAAQKLLPKNSLTYFFNQALMDFGAMICTNPKPKCAECPMQKLCISYPEIETASTKELRYIKKVKEKQYYGHPRRIWRGRVLKYLHTVGDDGVTLTQIGHAMQNDYSFKRRKWLLDVIATLEKDSLIRTKDQRIYLP